MTSIHIQRAHQLDAAQARQVAQTWGQKTTAKLGVQCRYENREDSGLTHDTLHFEHMGINGTLQVHAAEMVLDASLSPMFAMFQQKIEEQIHTQFDALLSPAA